MKDGDRLVLEYNKRHALKRRYPLIGQPSLDTNKPLMSAEVLADNKDFPEVDNLFWIREYRRGEWPAMCYEN